MAKSPIKQLDIEMLWYASVEDMDGVRCCIHNGANRHLKLPMALLKTIREEALLTEAHTEYLAKEILNNFAWQYSKKGKVGDLGALE